MDETVLKVSLAALFHDIGKFAQEGLTLPPGYRENNADLYQPFKNGHHTHTHALYTAAFIEKYQTYFPEELNSHKWGEGEREDSFINLAAKHHKPETPLQLIISQADRLSSGFDRAEFEKGEEIGVREYRQTRLLPIFERLLRRDKKFDKPEDFEWRYPLAPISAQNIFPVKPRDLEKQEAKEEYRRLFKDFESDLKKLCHRKHVELWAQHFDSLLRVYTSHIPAARVGRVVHDVSLYDHLRTTAALAGALYLYHHETDTFYENAISDDRLKKFLLVSGDFYGIQNFIFRGGGEERHHRAKLLRGRSFLVSLMMELAAEMLCEKAGLSFLAVFFAAAGKFHLLAPNIERAKKAIEETREGVNKWLYENFFGECAIGFALTEASPADFTGENFAKLWQRHLDNLEEAKFHRFELDRVGGVFKDYLDSFDNELPKSICPLCGQRPSAREVLNDDYLKRRGQEEGACACKLCRDQAFLGTKLVSGKRLAVLKAEKGSLKEPLFGVYQVRFLEGYAEELARDNILIRLYDLNIEKDGKAPIGATFLPINGYVPVFHEEDKYDDRYLAGQSKEEKKLSLIDQIDVGAPKTFHHLAQLALEPVDQKTCAGFPALGVLKADVDNLGAIFGCGLPAGLFTISRLSTMSRQLNNFFTIYLPYALEHEKDGRFKDTYTVFAGGDDLFLIGPWNRVCELALFLREKFAQYVCQNPKLHFSAGITLHKPHVPVDLLAEEAEEALNLAKGTDSKNSVSMFGRVVTWDEFEDLSKIENTLSKWLNQKIFTRSALYRLNNLVFLAEEEARLLSSGSIPWHRLQCVKWPAFLRYFLVRLIERQVKNNWQATYQQVVNKLYAWLVKYRGSFVLALWPLLYKIRKQKI